MRSGLDIWELAVLPKLLYNADRWQEISPNTVQELENLQLEEFLIKNGITKLSIYSKTQWKTFVKAEVLKLNKAGILQKMRRQAGAELCQAHAQVD